MAILSPKELALKDLDAVFAEEMPWVELVDFDPGDGGTVVEGIPAILKRLGERDRDGGLVYDGLVRLRQSDVSSRPGYRAEIQAKDASGDPETWYVVKAEGVRGVWHCECERDNRAKFRRQ